MIKYTITFSKPNGKSLIIEVPILPFVFEILEERQHLIIKNKETITIIVEETNKSIDFPSKGVYFSKDLMKRLDYILVDDVYEYYIYKAKLKMCGNKTKVKYKKVTALGRFTDLNNFATYLYCEGFIDEKPKQIEQ